MSLVSRPLPAHIFDAVEKVLVARISRKTPTEATDEEVRTASRTGGQVHPRRLDPRKRPRGGPVTTGRCACGAVRYRVEGPLRPVIACHCETCRRTGGHHVAATAAPRDRVAIEGEVAWYRSSSEARRGFCPTCGSQLFWDGPGRNLSILAGTLDAPTGLALAGHIFCAEKGDYYTIADGLPRAAGRDPALTTVSSE